MRTTTGSWASWWGRRKLLLWLVSEVVASGEGDTGGSVQVNLEHVAAVCVPVNRCWWPEDAKQAGMLQR